jgi:hypothetical protein
MVLSFQCKRENTAGKRAKTAAGIAVKKTGIFSGGLCEPASVGDFELSRVA